MNAIIITVFLIYNNLFYFIATTKNYYYETKHRKIPHNILISLYKNFCFENRVFLCFCETREKNTPDYNAIEKPTGKLIIFIQEGYWLCVFLF